MTYQTKCPGVGVGNHSIIVDFLMCADDLLVISPSPEGLQQSLDATHKHAQDWKFKGRSPKSQK